MHKTQQSVACIALIAALNVFTFTPVAKKKSKHLRKNPRLTRPMELKAVDLPYIKG